LAIGLPTLSVSSKASSSRLARISSENRIRIRLRSIGGMRDQAPDSKAARPDFTAASTSSWPQDATFTRSRPSPGKMQSKVSFVRAST
jgi:hypothetical protein